MDKEFDAHAQSIDGVLLYTQANANIGLSEQEAINRLRRYGPNVLIYKKAPSPFIVFIQQFKSPLLYLLLIAALLIAIFGNNLFDACIISGILFFNAIIGTIQEWRAHKIIASLSAYTTNECVVLRDNHIVIIDNSQITIGDVLLLKPGQQIAADARLIHVDNLLINEASLTGEAEPIAKNIDILPLETNLADRLNMVYKGTYCLAGTGKAIVINIGNNTEIGTIQHRAQTISMDILLQKDIKKLSYIIIIIIFIMCTTLFFIGLYADKSFNELIIILSALFICVIPEGLPAVLTLVLVTGAHQLARKNILIKNMQAIESLGRTEIIIIDKTGTLTRNEMMVSKAWINNNWYTITGQGYATMGEIIPDHDTHVTSHDSSFQHLADACILLNNAIINYDKKLNTFSIVGDPTEAALFIFSKKLLDNNLNVNQYQLIYEIPFNTNLKYHAALYSYKDKKIIFIAGSPEIIFAQLCKSNIQLAQALQELLDQGLRVIGIGAMEVDKIPQSLDQKTLAAIISNNLDNIHALALCGLQDTIRQEVISIIEQARKSGLHIIMATGDHAQTAVHIATIVGIFKEGDLVCQGSDLMHISDDQLKKNLLNITVYARVNPEQKLHIIELFKEQGFIIAMTGDGINDVLSLLSAHLGIAMGKIGTDVAKEAADVVLLDDSFVNIIHAIRFGRHIFATLRRVILYFFATNMGEILLIFFALLYIVFIDQTIPLPLAPAHILWLNLVTDGFLDAALGMEKEEPGLLSSTWLQRKQVLIDWRLLAKTVYMAMCMSIFSMIFFIWYLPKGKIYAQTIVLVTMAMFQWFNAWNCRSETRSLFSINFFSNKWLLIASLFVIMLQLFLLYTPTMNYLFNVIPIKQYDWLLITIIACFIIVFEEARKKLMRVVGRI